jgi:hypothetical protein
MRKIAKATYRRSSPRKNVSPTTISSMASLDSMAKICKGGELIQASSSGLLLLVKRDHLIPDVLRRNLNIDALVGGKVIIHLADFNLEVSGTVARTKYVGKQGFEIGIDYTDDAPEYWRECLVDLMPFPGEIEE